MPGLFIVAPGTKKILIFWAWIDKKNAKLHGQPALWHKPYNAVKRPPASMKVTSPFRDSIKLKLGLMFIH